MSKPKNMTKGGGVMKGVEAEIPAPSSMTSFFSAPLGPRSTAILHSMKLGLAGMITGAVYGLIQAEAKNKGVLSKVPENTRAFELDNVACNLFFRLGKYRHLHEAAYDEAVKYCDHIFMKEKELARSRKPTDADMSLIETWILAVLGCIMLMRERAYNNPQIYSDIVNLKKEINSMLKQHRGVCYALTASTRSFQT